MHTPGSTLEIEVEQLARTQPFALVEEFIETLSVDADQKAALWLLAWSYVSRAEQRRVAYEALGTTRPRQG